MLTEKDKTADLSIVVDCISKREIRPCCTNEKRLELSHRPRFTNNRIELCSRPFFLFKLKTKDKNHPQRT